MTEDCFEAVVPRAKEVTFRPFRIDDIDATEVVVETLFSGISKGTEIRRYLGLASELEWHDGLSVYLNSKSSNRWPIRNGYENVGRIVRCGSTVDPSLKGRLIWTPSNHSTHVVLKISDYEHGLIPAADDVGELENYTFVARTRIAMAGIHDAEILLGDVVGVVGFGAVGFLAAQLALLSGARKVYVLDTDPRPLQLASIIDVSAILVENKATAASIKETLGDILPDKIIECSGTSAGLNLAMRLVRSEGTIVTISTYSSPSANDLGVDLMGEWGRNRLTLKSSMSVNNRSHRRSPLWTRQRQEQVAIALIGQRDVIVHESMKRRYFFRELQTAYETLSKDGADSSALVVY
ncbi:zinc-binding dehydrogenase [Rhizobium leguminosarum]|uniref:zinc-binding dehydrogenase n=1 Tax=Rhizobium leguminosarum TaxID=384 RepID=UPI001C974EC8|nr:zinc-binding dehydrogenase [Rhizobium leguminosarum]MBY5336074.1 zinc-binding dehydrogenase [Rhizobium leguminosarum]